MRIDERKLPGGGEPDERDEFVGAGKSDERMVTCIVPGAFWFRVDIEGRCGCAVCRRGALLSGSCWGYRSKRQARLLN